MKIPHVHVILVIGNYENFTLMNGFCTLACTVYVFFVMNIIFAIDISTLFLPKYNF